MNSKLNEVKEKELITPALSHINSRRLFRIYSYQFMEYFVKEEKSSISKKTKIIVRFSK